MIIFALSFKAIVKRIFLVSFFFVTFLGFGQSLTKRELVKDLRPGWKIFEDDTFLPYSASPTKNITTVYFEVDPGRYETGSHIEIKGATPFSVYLNYQLITFGVKTISINIDSLRQLVAPPWMFSVYQSKRLSWLQTEISSPVYQVSDLSNHLRSPSDYLNFSILAFLFLSIFFVALLRTNPRLTFDYFNFVRLFSIQEREDTLLNSRISASVNMLYYIFCSLLTGFTLLTIFHFGAEAIAVAKYFTIHSVLHGFWQWLKLSLLIMLALMGKLILLSALSQMFDFREAPGPQFYNYVRLTFFICTTAGLVCLCYFVFNIQSPRAYTFLLNGIILMLIFWVLMIGLKLLRRSSFRFFHLFSYLCASELIPIVILVKVLNS